jgi:transposase InsO family protein
MRRRPVVLVELGLVEQRYQAVLAVLNDGALVTDVARRTGVSRQTVHEWLVRYANHGLAGLADSSSRPRSCPHQMSPQVEARIVELRREHPGWGPRTLGHRLGVEGLAPVPGRTSIYRCLVRHGLITPQARRRKRVDYKRWERSQAMDLWQMDVVGGVHLVDGTEAKVVTGLDDHSRFCVSAFVTARATARPTCDALALALRLHGIPQQILTDNGKVFTNRFGKGVGEVLFDRMCRDNGIGHLLTAPRSPTTTGKVERFHKTLRREFLADRTFVSIEDAQAQLDSWVRSYNFERPHQSLGMAVPWDRFRLAQPAPGEPDQPVVVAEPEPSVVPTVTRRVGSNGLISFATAHYRAGVWLAGENVSVICDGGLVHLEHRGVLIATHARRHSIEKQSAGLLRGVRPPKLRRSSATAASVTRKVDSSGSVCFAGTTYRVSPKLRRRQVQVSVVGETVEISIGEELIRTHPIRHNRTREHGALANPGGRPHRINAA